MRRMPMVGGGHGVLVGRVRKAPGSIRDVRNWPIQIQAPEGGEGNGDGASKFYSTTHV